MEFDTNILPIQKLFGCYISKTSINQIKSNADYQTFDNYFENFLCVLFFFWNRTATFFEENKS